MQIFYYKNKWKYFQVQKVLPFERYSCIQQQWLFELLHDKSRHIMFYSFSLGEGNLLNH